MKERGGFHSSLLVSVLCKGSAHVHLVLKVNHKSISCRFGICYSDNSDSCYAVPNG
jgi:hypothetical protein